MGKIWFIILLQWVKLIQLQRPLKLSSLQTFIRVLRWKSIKHNMVYQLWLRYSSNLRCKLCFPYITRHDVYNELRRQATLWVLCTDADSIPTVTDNRAVSVLEDTVTSSGDWSRGGRPNRITDVKKKVSDLSIVVVKTRLISHL